MSKIPATGVTEPKTFAGDDSALAAYLTDLFLLLICSVLVFALNALSLFGFFFLLMIMMIADWQYISGSGAHARKWDSTLLLNCSYRLFMKCHHEEDGQI